MREREITYCWVRSILLVTYLIRDYVTDALLIYLAGVWLGFSQTHTYRTHTHTCLVFVSINQTSPHFCICSYLELQTGYYVFYNLLLDDHFLHSATWRRTGSSSHWTVCYSPFGWCGVPEWYLPYFVVSSFSPWCFDISFYISPQILRFKVCAR